jgi:hypothetical protein
MVLPRACPAWGGSGAKPATSPHRCETGKERGCQALQRASATCWRGAPPVCRWQGPRQLHRSVLSAIQWNRRRNAPGDTRNYHSTRNGGLPSPDPQGAVGDLYVPVAAAPDAAWREEAAQPGVDPSASQSMFNRALRALAPGSRYIKFPYSSNVDFSKAVRIFTASG